jgi:hypothetical protein
VFNIPPLRIQAVVAGDLDRPARNIRISRLSLNHLDRQGKTGVVYSKMITVIRGLDMLILSLTDFSRKLDDILKEVPGNEVIINKNHEPWIKLVSSGADTDPWEECLKLLDASMEEEFPDTFPRVTFNNTMAL